MDDPSITLEGGKWSQERYNEIVAGLTPFLKSCGYNPKKDIIFLPISGLLGHNLKDRVPANICPWWKVRARQEHAVTPIDIREPAQQGPAMRHCSLGQVLVISAWRGSRLTASWPTLSCLCPFHTKLS